MQNVNLKEQEALMGLTTEAVGYLEKKLTWAVKLGGLQQNATLEYCKMART